MVAHWLCTKASGIHFYRTHAYFLDDALTRLRSRKKKKQRSVRKIKRSTRRQSALGSPSEVRARYHKKVISPIKLILSSYIELG